MLRVGLTGGLASGKSTVAAMFRALGARHVDADAIAHGLLAPGGAAEAAVLARFGTTERKSLGAIVFADPKALADLNAIVHPLVRAAIVARLAEAARGKARVAVVDAALLVETGIHRDLDALVVVSCPPDVQLARAVARGMDEADARRRIASQAPLEEKVAAADHVVDNGGPLEATERQVRRIWEELARRAG